MLGKRVIGSIVFVALATYFEFGLIGIIAVLFYGIFSNLSNEDPDAESSTRTTSAYSVFNEDGRTLPGTFGAQDLDGMTMMAPNSSRVDRNTMALAQEAQKQIATTNPAVRYSHISIYSTVK